MAGPDDIVNNRHNVDLCRMIYVKLIMVLLSSPHHHPHVRINAIVTTIGSEDVVTFVKLNVIMVLRTGTVHGVGVTRVIVAKHVIAVP